MSNILSPLEKAAILSGCGWLQVHKDELVAKASSFEGPALDRFVAVVKGAEPHGGFAAFFEAAFNTVLDNLEAGEKAAIPTQDGAVIDWLIAKGTAFAGTL